MTIRTLAGTPIECRKPPEHVTTGYKCRTDRSQSDRRWLMTVRE